MLIKQPFTKLYILSILILGWGCTEQKQTKQPNKFTIAFGSCNNQNLENNLWDDILKSNPDVFIWGGDVIYCDTEDMALMKKNYNIQKNNSAYQNFSQKVEVLGTWDDHDYGLNDGGKSYSKKDSVQQLFLDFLNVSTHSKRRKQKGIYHSQTFKIDDKSVQVFILDTRFFRDSLTKDPTGVKRYIPSKDSTQTMLGNIQWQWLERELNQSKAQFNIIVSSIQVWSQEHGFESWGNLPHERDKLQQIIAHSGAKGVIILSGDRHIAEFSKKQVKGMSYPIFDLTSSGMTHIYSDFSGESNPYRVSKVINQKNFGLIKLQLDEQKMTAELRGENNQLFQQVTYQYKN